MQNQMNIKKALIKANKYGDVKAIITGIAENITPSEYPEYPAKPFVDSNGETKWRVAGKSVKEEAIELINIIEGMAPEDTESLFTSLLAYVTNISDSKLRDYAVMISHRKEPDEDIDNIRSWEVLEFLIHHLRMRRACPHENHVFDVPEGWHRK